VGNDQTDSTTGLNNDGLGNGVLFRNSRIRLADITDGSSQTIVVAERAWSINSGLWAGVISNGVIRRGPANPCPKTGALFHPAATLVQAHCNLLNTVADPDGGLDDFCSRHPGGANVVFADGSVHFLKSVLRNSGTRSNGSTIYSPASLVLQALGTRSGGEVLSADAY
jgi:prepilin-type processing-associated H-X9-DG protein